MLTTSKDQLARYANDVQVLWDEAQDNPALLRFLSPFGRPDLGRLMRRFQAAGAVVELIGEGYPMYATWLATMVQRDGLHPSSDTLALPKWDNSVLTPSLTLATPVELGQGQLRTLVVAGSLKAPMVRVLGERLVVAGDLETKLLVADGCVLVGGSIKADIVAAPASRLSNKERAPFDPARPLGVQVSREVVCRVFDSPRFGVGCPVKAEVVVRGVGVPVTPAAGERLRELMVPQTLTAGRLDLDEIARRTRTGTRSFVPAPHPGPLPASQGEGDR